MIHWFKKHPEYLKQESESLNKDANYKEIIQVRNNLFISHGNVIVRLEKITRHPIIIVYTNATPYELPLVFPLKEAIPNDEVEAISKLPLNGAIKRINKYVQYYYELRHQNPAGNLCILEWETLDQGAPFIGIPSVLKRAKQWFEGTLTGNFPPDNQEVEYAANFKGNVDFQTQLLYPDSFLDPTKLEGEFYAPLFSYVPRDKDPKNGNYIFLGRYINGIPKTGFSIILNEELPDEFPEELSTSDDLFNKKLLVQKLIREKKLLGGVWFDIDNEPPPFQGFSRLIEIIGNGNTANGKERLGRTALPYLKLGADEFFIALRFPNRKKELEFQLFKLTKNTAGNIILTGESEQARESAFAYYDKVDVTICDKITPSNFHERNGNRAKYDLLKAAKVNIVGAGAIGSDVADSIGKAGIGNITVTDFQTMKVHNIIRHATGSQAIGLPKSIAVAMLVRSHNPFVWVNPQNIDVLREDVNDYIAEDSISIVCIADDNTESSFNEQAVIANRVAFYVRALRGGRVGRIFRVIPGKDACFHCLSLYRDDKKEFISIPDDPAYATVRNECNNPIRPASAADLKIISSLASRLVIEHLQNGEQSANHWIWSTEAIDQTPIAVPYSVHAQTIPPNPNCVYCNLELQYTVEISPTALSYMQDLVQKSGKKETGGVLAGYVDNGKIIVTDASGPGSKAICEETRFQKDAAYCQEFLDNLYKDKGGKIVYVGEWHSHPSNSNTPSGVDIKSLTDISYQQEYLTDKPVMIIFSKDGRPSATIHPTGKRFYYATITEQS